MSEKMTEAENARLKAENERLTAEVVRLSTPEWFNDWNDGENSWCDISGPWEDWAEPDDIIHMVGSRQVKHLWVAYIPKGTDRYEREAREFPGEAEAKAALAAALAACVDDDDE